MSLRRSLLAQSVSLLSTSPRHVVPASRRSRAHGGSDARHDSEQLSGQFAVPWHPIIQQGVDILRNPTYNKGMCNIPSLSQHPFSWCETVAHVCHVLLSTGLAFTMAERRELRIEGLLPPYVISQSVQVQRVLEQFRS
jgi:hypothetical protein